MGAFVGEAGGECQHRSFEELSRNQLGIVHSYSDILECVMYGLHFRAEVLENVVDLDYKGHC